MQNVWATLGGGGGASQIPTPQGGLRTPKWFYGSTGFVSDRGSGYFVLGIQQGGPMCSGHLFFLHKQLTLQGAVFALLTGVPKGGWGWGGGRLFSLLTTAALRPVLWGNPCTARALRATFRLDSPMKNPHTDPFQTPSKLGHPSYPNAPKFKSLKLP